MSVQENKAFVKRNYEAPWTEANLAERVTPDFVAHYPKGPQTLEEYFQNGVRLGTAFPDLHFTIEELIGEREFVVVRWTARGTFLGAYMGIKPTGKPVEVTGIEIVHMVDGKAHETWVNWDDLGMLQQMGALPELGAVPV